jgi:hypothetical protein
MTKILFEFPAELTWSAEMEFVRRRFCGIAAFDKFQRLAHSQGLQPVLGRLLELREKETLQLSFRDRTEHCHVIALVAGVTRDAHPILDPKKTAPLHDGEIGSIKSVLKRNAMKYLGELLTGRSR